MWQSGRRKSLLLLGLALLAVGLQTLLEDTRAPHRQRDYDLKMAAANLASQAFATLRSHRALDGATIDMVNDPAGTGLIGPELSPITNARGDLEAKLTALNPNFAAVMVKLLLQAGVQAGDPVAVSVSGSFPGLNICLYSALQVLDAQPVVISSVGASMWGANNPEFTWLDMEKVLHDAGVLHNVSSASTYGGGDDMGRGLSRSGRNLIADAIARNGVPWIESRNIEDAIVNRMAFFDEAVHGQAYTCFVNVGGGVASLGNNRGRLLVPRGLSIGPTAENWPRKGIIALMADRGVPVVHILEIAALARDFGLPVAPDYLAEPGEGEIFVRDAYRLGLTALFFVFYTGLCVILLAPEARRHLVQVWIFRKRRRRVSV